MSTEITEDTTVQPTANPEGIDTPASGTEQPASGAEDQAQQSEAAKTEDGQKPQSEGAPEQYDFTAPEGVTFDGAVIDAFSEVARELDLPQEAAQKVLDKMAPVMAARQSEQVQTLREQWTEQSRTDAEFGGDKLPENLAVAKKAMDAFATPELKTLLNESGLGDHPEIIRAFYRAGRAISEDRLVTGSPTNTSSQNDARRLYGASNMNP